MQAGFGAGGGVVAQLQNTRSVVTEEFGMDTMRDEVTATERTEMRVEVVTWDREM